MDRNVIAVLCAGLLLAAAPSALRAEDEDHDGGGKPAHEMSAAKLKDKLGLTDDQVTKLDAAWKAQKEAAKPLHEQMKKDMEKLKDQVKNKAKDDEIQATLDSLAATRKSMRESMEKTHADADAILTPTQRAKMVLKMAHARKHWWSKWGHKKDKDGDKKSDSTDAKKG
jgi:Spy/CpxP family protein refolding chaperone